MITKEQSSKETIDGNRAIFFREGKAYMEQLAPTEIVPEKEYQRILSSMNLKEEDLLPGFKPVIVNTGNSFLLIPLSSTEVLRTIEPNLKMISELSAELGLIGFYPFTLQTSLANSDAAARMFAPFYGINEEAATGMAGGPLAGYLFSSGLVHKHSLLIEQGWYMKQPSPSLIYAELEIENDNIKKVFAGGNAYAANQFEIQLN